MNKIYVLEGADGTGKTTLAREIMKQKGAHYLHCSYDKSWDIRSYHKQVMLVAQSLRKYQPVVIDRWAPSEHVYGMVFRNGPSYDVMDMLWEADDPNVKWIFCTHDNAVENHLKNKERRDEMFDDMQEVVKQFHQFIEATDFLAWSTFNFGTMRKQEFVRKYL